ncbi:MAG: DUF2007 domain-containing protein [Maricaulaceae bacterium]
MKTVLKTTNPATLNFAEAILKDADIPAFIMDQHMSMLEGSIGIIPRRIMVVDEDAEDAKAALTANGLDEDIYHGK